MAFDRVFQGPPSDTAAPGTAQSPSFGIDVVNSNLYFSAGEGWQEIVAAQDITGDLDVDGTLAVNGHSALGVGATIDSVPTEAPDESGTISSKAIVVVEETATGDLENGSYLGLTLNPSTAPSTTTAIGAFTDLVAEGENLGGTALFASWSAATLEVNTPASAPAISGGVIGAYIKGNAEVPFAGGLTVDAVNFGTATVDDVEALSIFIGNISSGTISGCDGLAVSYNASGAGSTVDALNYIHLESPNNTGDIVTALVGLQIDALEASGVGTVTPIKSDSVGASVFAGPIELPYSKAQTVYSAAGTPIPAAATAGVGARAFVSDSTAAGVGGFAAPYVSGGTHKVPVYSDGTGWFIG